MLRRDFLGTTLAAFLFPAWKPQKHWVEEFWENATKSMNEVCIKRNLFNSTITVANLYLDWGYSKQHPNEMAFYFWGYADKKYYDEFSLRLENRLYAGCFEMKRPPYLNNHEIMKMIRKHQNDCRFEVQC